MQAHEEILPKGNGKGLKSELTRRQTGRRIPTNDFNCLSWGRTVSVIGRFEVSADVLDRSGLARRLSSCSIHWKNSLEHLEPNLHRLRQMSIRRHSACKTSCTT